jgi:aromatic-L-amino-acid decarboxylase
MNDVKTHIVPGVTHWQHPSFFAFFPSNSSPPGLLGEMLSGMFNVVGFNWICSPACTELETIVLDWMAKVINSNDHAHH